MEVAAAGGLLWREFPDGNRIAVIHRNRYDDWTLPKGKLEPGESWLDAAMREVIEETGFTPRLLGFAGAIAYEVGEGPKVVRYWNMAADKEKESEIDHSEVTEIVWMTPARALERLTYPLEKAIVEVWGNTIFLK